MDATTQATSTLESGHSADEIKSYVLRTDSIVPCSIADVHSIPQALKDIEAYWLGTVPCRTVRLVGIIVSAIEYESRGVYSVDDGTGTVSCIKKRPVRLEVSELTEESIHIQSRGYDIGDTVSVVGKIQEYKGSRQIFVSSIHRCLIPDAESRHILEVLEQHQTRYTQPFTIPPLPAPITPRKNLRPDPQSSCPPSMASSPTTTGLSSPVVSPRKVHARLRHPSRLRSKDLNENVFRIYLSHILISTLFLPESPKDEVASVLDNSTPRPSRIRSTTDYFDETPKRPHRSNSGALDSPPFKRPAQYQHSSGSPEDHPLLGVTLSYLRRVQVLAELARRVVDQAAHERDKILRHAERNARAKYETSHPPSSKCVSRRKPADLAANCSGSSPQPKPTSSSARQIRGSRDVLNSRHDSVRQMSSAASSSRTLSSITKSPSHAKVQRAETLTPLEAARRAAYHAKQSKLHAEDTVKRPARIKRLFESALRTLVKEGGAVLYDGPRRRVPSGRSDDQRVFATSSGLWPEVTNTTAAGSSQSLMTASNDPGGRTCSGLSTISEDNDYGEISDPSDSEDAYLPVTSRTLRPALLAALRQSLMRHRGGVDFTSWMRTLRSDEQWSRVPDLVLKEAVDMLREDEWIDKVGGGRWDFTRGSWAKSLSLS